MADVNLENLDFAVADANLHMRKLVRTMLTGFGVRRVHEAGDGATALEIVEAYMPQILICDTKMPIIDGFELMQMIRDPKASKSPYIPIIVVTAQTERNNIIRIRNAGATEILCKPFSISALFVRIQNIILNPRPFVESDTYFGPDRRRKVDPSYAGPLRRAEDAMSLERNAELADGDLTDAETTSAGAG